jgi:ferredoxin
LNQSDSWKHVKRYCHYCGTVINGYKDNKGVFKGQCEKCGVCVVSRPAGRRSEKTQTFAVDNPSNEYT